MASSRIYMGADGRWREQEHNPLLGMAVGVHPSLSPGFASKYAGRLADAARHWDAEAQWDGEFELFGLRLGDRVVGGDAGGPGGAGGAGGGCTVGVCVVFSRRVWRVAQPGGVPKQWIEIRAAADADLAVCEEFAG